MFDRKALGFTVLYLVVLVLSIAAIIIFVFAWQFKVQQIIPSKRTNNTHQTLKDKKQETSANTLSEPDSIANEPKVIGTNPGVKTGIKVINEWNSYEDSKYNFEVKNPGDWILYVNDFENSYLNFRLKEDNTPAEHGFSLAVLENTIYTTAKELCESGNSKDESILCSEDITTEGVTIGSKTWEKVRAQDIGIIPSGYIALTTYENGNLFYVISEGYTYEQILEVLQSFKFL